MNWQRIESLDHRGLVMHYTNDQPNMDFCISNQCVDKYKLAVHTAGRQQGECLNVVFRTLEDAKDYAEELSKTENACTTNRIVDLLADYLASTRLGVQR